MSTASDSAPMRFGNLELLAHERVLRVGGKPVAVGGRAYDLLFTLA